jgi:ABC-type sugar transport system ATPase subunit
MSASTASTPVSSKFGATALLRLDGIVKRFGEVTVLDRVGFEVARGEVHALVGENGAGKSTLMHILAGVHQPDAGRIDFNGRCGVRIENPHHAQKLGVVTVFQERSLFMHLSVADNIFAGRQPQTRLGAIDHRRLAREVRALLKEVGLHIEPGMLVEELSPAKQQLVVGATALSLDAKLILFDEPTAALTESETRELFRIISVLRSRGVGIIYISHRLEEIFEIADRVTVLKDGQGQGTMSVTATSPEQLVRLMVGRPVLANRRSPAAGVKSARPVLEVRGLSDHPNRHQSLRLHDIGFEAWGGEILGFAGLAGAGRTETALSIIGVRARATGEIFVNGCAVEILNPAESIAQGIGYLPEDRKMAGLFADMTISENMGAANLRHFGGWWFDDAQQDAYAEQCRRRLRVGCRDVAQPIIELSGGNQQKCILARWLLVDPKILIVDEPTRGIDVGAKDEVHALLRELANRGTAVIVISSDLPEVLAVSDRILVMHHGRVAGVLDGEGASEADVMRLASLDRTRVS